MAKVETKKKKDPAKVAKKAGTGSIDGAVSNNNNNKVVEMEQKILKAMVLRYRNGKMKPMNSEALAKAVGTHIRTKSYIEARKSLVAKEYIEKGHGGEVLTETGAAAAGYVQADHDHSNAASDDELHKSIKGSLNPKWKGSEIFDFLLNRGPLSRKELAELVRVNDRSHSFSYGLKELKENDYAAKSANGKVDLTDNCFVNGKP